MASGSSVAGEGGDISLNAAIGGTMGGNVMLQGGDSALNGGSLTFKVETYSHCSTQLGV